MHDAKIVLIYAICTTEKGIFGGGMLDRPWIGHLTDLA